MSLVQLTYLCIPGSVQVSSSGFFALSSVDGSQFRLLWADGALAFCLEPETVWCLARTAWKWLLCYTAHG